VISQNAKWGHAGFYIDCHRMTVPENILLQKSTGFRRHKEERHHGSICDVAFGSQWSQLSNKAD